MIGYFELPLFFLIQVWASAGWGYVVDGLPRLIPLWAFVECLDCVTCACGAVGLISDALDPGLDSFMLGVINIHGFKSYTTEAEAA
ncbi:hypothetical protein GCM10009603_08950 [Nocardiopsis exhalans]